MARYRKYKLGRFSTGIRSISANEKIVSIAGVFSIILVLRGTEEKQYNDKITVEKI